jgi:LmbE family N-acetylglucosaminyl deacetylase
LHPDHRHAGLLAVEGIVAARDPHFFPEQGVAPWRPSTLLLWEADQVDHVEPLDPAAVEAKLAALLAHRSQLRSTMHIDDEADAAQVAAFRDKVLGRLAEHSGEPFKRITEL